MQPSPLHTVEISNTTQLLLRRSLSTAEIFLTVLVLISISSKRGSLSLLFLFETIAQKGSFPFSVFSSTKTRKADADHCSLSLDRL